MNEFVLGQLDAYCYMVERGKPAAMIPVQKHYTAEAIKFISKCSNSKLKVFVENLSDDWDTLWIYKYPHILEVIKELQQAPDNIFSKWALGKLFGYDEESIQNFINRS
ncbi:hypothetical protein BBF96_03340 [Anoxybacter fermentans]|uniref:Uncharacterized protein n=1 Tax=Anoxybacter fermentans TaxID=1323375 RepID=A0A3Q9HP48_9FIRM|nr:hypothetical protein [Anoxybacter fermentans]AZR72499.1 hypothetical protein BBF96_03340 [Anoxybacter fermentans]